MKTFKIYLYTTVLLTTVTLLCITMLWCIYCITGNLYFWNTFTILPKSHPLPLATTNLFSISWVCLFSDPYVSETNHTVFVFLWCISLSIMSSRGFLHSSVSKDPSAMQEAQVLFLVQEDPLEKEMTTPLFLSGKSHRQRSLAGYSPWGCKSQTRLSN